MRRPVIPSFIYLSVVICALSTESSAQFKMDANVTGKHAQLLGAPKRTKAQLQARKEQMENYRNYMTTRNVYVKAYDSAKVVYLDSIYMAQNYAIGYRTDSLWSGLPDSLQYDFQPTPDSIKVSQKVLNKGDFPSKSVRQLANPPKRPSVGQLKASIRDYKEYAQIRK